MATETKTKTASKISAAGISRPLSFKDFVELAQGSYEQILSTLEIWRDARMIAQVFPGFGDPPNDGDRDDAVVDYIEDMRPAARFANIALKTRDRALLILLYLVQQSTPTSTWERGQPDPLLFVRFRTLNDIPGLSRQDGDKMAYVFAWINARHLNTMPLDVVQVLSQHRYGRLVAAYFKAVHYHDREHKVLDLFLQHTAPKPLGYILLTILLACSCLTIVATAILTLTGRSLPVNNATVYAASWLTAVVAFVLLQRSKR